MALRSANEEKIEKILHQDPQITIFLRPIAPPAALALAGFSGSTFIAAAWIANWFGNSESPLIFFPFVAFWGGLAQFIAGIFGFLARDVLVTVINTMWGAFWMSIGLLYALVAFGAVPPHAINTHFPELASWFVVLAAFTWSGVSTICPMSKGFTLMNSRRSLQQHEMLSCVPSSAALQLVAQSHAVSLHMGPAWPLASKSQHTSGFSQQFSHGGGRRCT